MLFNYPPEANDENWLHDCVTALVEGALEAIRDGAPVPAWPNCLPAPWRAQLERRTGVRDRYAALIQAAQVLTVAQLETALCAVSSQNNIPAVYDGVTECGDLSDLPAAFRQAALSLYKFAFKLLSDFGLRDAQYQKIYDHLPSKVCPFCGSEYFDAPGLPRHDLDHYIAISLYPFAGANLNNLVPMGDRCNSAYKKAENVLYNDAGGQRPAFDPYGTEVGALSLIGSQLFSPAGIQKPTWQIDLGANPASETWDDVWKIRVRFEKNVLDPSYEHWISEFGLWCASTQKQVSTEAAARTALESYKTILVPQRFSDRAFVKIAFVDLLLSFIDDPALKDRTISFLSNVVEHS